MTLLLRLFFFENLSYDNDLESHWNNTSNEKLKQLLSQMEDEQMAIITNGNQFSYFVWRTSIVDEQYVSQPTCFVSHPVSHSNSSDLIQSLIYFCHLKRDTRKLMDNLHSKIFLGEGSSGQVHMINYGEYAMKTARDYRCRMESLEYQNLESVQLPFVPRYYALLKGTTANYKDHLLIEYIPGRHCYFYDDPKLRKRVEELRQLLQAIGVRHNQSSIRPDNVFIDDKDNIKISDFGNMTKASLPKYKHKLTSR